MRHHLLIHRLVYVRMRTNPRFKTVYFFTKFRNGIDELERTSLCTGQQKYRFFLDLRRGSNSIPYFRFYGSPNCFLEAAFINLQIKAMCFSSSAYFLVNYLLVSHFLKSDVFVSWCSIYKR